MWLDVIVGVAAAVVVVPIVFYLVQWRDAQMFRASGLSQFETLRTLWWRFEREVLRRLRQLHKDVE